MKLKLKFENTTGFAIYANICKCIIKLSSSKKDERDSFFIKIVKYSVVEEFGG